jgi:tRNA threonylcarbamoyladenosine biosynthesis protein TsaE
VNPESFCRLISRSPEETQEIGRKLGESAAGGDIYLLQGELGAGKTTLAQGILWGAGGVEYARSPTFVLVNEYVARLPVYHIDLYRTGSFDEVADLGLDEYLFGDGVCIVEWPDRAPAYFPQEHALIELEVTGPTARGITISATSARYSRTFEALAGPETH